MTADKIKSVNPSRIDQVVGYCAKADKALAEKNGHAGCPGGLCPLVPRACHRKGPVLVQSRRHPAPAQV